MTHRRTSLPCGFQEDALIAVALDEADAALRQAVHTHIQVCQACCGVLARYCSVQQVLTALHDSRDVEEPLQRAQAKLTHRLVRQPVVHCSYAWCSTVLGQVCIAQSEHGVSLVTWETHAARFLTRLERQAGVAVHEDQAALQALLGELQAYLAGACNRLPWPIDERCMRSAFQRDVLHLATTIPYGAVMSYQSVAAALGQPKAVRAVAQALRYNPLAIIVPCHRVIGQTGHLTGYAGGLERKCTLLTSAQPPYRRLYQPGAHVCGLAERTGVL
jgi:O-6-methylguanine DNA methyltransferase